MTLGVQPYSGSDAVQVHVGADSAGAKVAAASLFTESGGVATPVGAATPLPVASVYQGVGAITPGTVVAAGRGLGFVCSTAGPVTLTLADGSTITLTLPASPSFQVLPFAVTLVALGAGTAATFWTLK